MKRRPLTLIVLGAVVLLVAAVGGLLAWHPWGVAAASAAAASTAAASAANAGPPMKFVQISEVSQDLLRSIELIGPAGSITLDNAKGSWQIVKPAVLGVKKSSMDDLLYSLANLASERVIEEKPADLSIYGLAPAVVTVRMTLASGEVRELYLGDMTPAGDTYYLMAKGDPRVFTVRGHHGTYFHYGIRDLWEGALQPVDGTDITYLRLRKAGKVVVELKRTPELAASDVEFRGTATSVTYPYTKSPRPADGSFLASFAKALSSLQSTNAVDAGPKNLASYGLDKPAAELELSDGQGNSIHVFVGRQDGQVLFMRFENDPTVYAGDPSFAALLDVQPFQFVSKLAMIVKLDNVDRITFEAGKTRHVLEVKRASPGTEEGAQWLVDGRAVAEKPFKDFFVAAVSLQIDAFRDQAVSGDAEATISFALNRGPARTFTVRFVPYSQEFYAVLKNGAGDLLVNRQQVKFLFQSLEALVAATKG
jgi:hypothetical protein